VTRDWAEGLGENLWEKKSLLWEKKSLLWEKKISAVGKKNLCW
jgi:hypothetical protein